MGAADPAAVKTKPATLLAHMKQSVHYPVLKRVTRNLDVIF
jgi:hypothetical protein